MTVKEAKAIAKDHERLSLNMTRVMKQYGRVPMAECASMSPQTLTHRLQNPGMFTYDEIMSISRLTGIDAAKLLFGIIDLKGE